MRLFLFVLPLFALSGCGEVLQCALNGDNVEGRIVYSEGIDIRGQLRIDWSNNGFQSITGGKHIDNMHALPVFSYSMCVNTNQSLSFRAYQDLNMNNQLDAGESNGRFDGTSDGNAAFWTRNIPYTIGTEQWEVVRDVDITVDTP